MDCVGPVSELVKCVWPTLARHIGYVKDLTQNLKNLTEGIDDLRNRKDDLNAMINRQRPDKEPSEVCKAWIKKVEKIENQVKLIEGEIGSTRRCLDIGCCFPDIYSRMNQGKRVKTLLEDVSGLKQAASDFKGQEVVDPPLAVVENLDMDSTAESKASIDTIVQNLLECIREEKNQKIGLWGMGGIGKTTVMKSLNNRIEQDFEIVVWVTVSKEWTVRKLQNQIADRLKIAVRNKESDDTVARRLRLKLQTTKYLLLLDDLWRPVDLVTVGIPTPSKEIGSRVVFTSRSLRVCNEMGTDVNIKVNPLSEGEAWSLFCEKVGEAANDLETESIARQIVKECAGLPLAILVIGGSLRKVVDIHVWRNFLDELKSATFGVGSMEEYVFEQLKFSYDRLKNDNVKNCFLYCALYPEDWEISVDELAVLWRAEGFLDGMESLEKSYDKAHTILNDLINDSLLERSEYGVKMHDMVRDMALRLTSSDGAGPRFLVRAGPEIDESPNVEEWEKAERISLMNTKIFDLPGSPRCNSLATLLLYSFMDTDLNISSSFFQHMPNLGVLQIHQRSKALPSSVSSLVNLRGLFIQSGKIALPPEIGELKRLEVMYVTEVGSLPLEVRQLTRLRSLRMEFGSVEGMRTMCSEGFISSLHLLEDLRIYFTFGVQWHELAGIVVAEELSTLKHLTTLQFVFSTNQCLDHFLKQREENKCPKLRGFRISVALVQYDSSVMSESYTEEMGKKLVWASGEKTSDGVITSLLGQTDDLGLIQHKTARNLLDFGIENIKTLKVCKVDNCWEMEIVLDGSGCSRNGILPNLHELILSFLPKLRSICDGPQVFSRLTKLYIEDCPKLRYVFTRRVTMPNLEDLNIIRCKEMEEIVASVQEGVDNPPREFTKLTKLYIEHCPKLRYVFTRVTIQQMPNIKALRVYHCEEMEEIVASKEEVDDAVQLFFPRVESVEFNNDPKLMGIWKGVSQAWPLLRVLCVNQCPNLKILNLKVTENASALKYFSVEREWWEALEWDDDHDKHQAQLIYEGRFQN